MAAPCVQFAGKPSETSVVFHVLIGGVIVHDARLLKSSCTIRGAVGISTLTNKVSLKEPKLPITRLVPFFIPIRFPFTTEHISGCKTVQVKAEGRTFMVFCPITLWTSIGYS